MEKEFLRRAVKTMNKKYIGFDIRILPLLGLIALLVPAIVWWQYRWADALGFGALLLLCILFCRSCYDIWKEDTVRLLPIEDLVNSRKGKLKEFIFPYMRDFNAYRIVRGQDNIANLVVYFPSLLLEEVELKLKCQLRIDSNPCLPISIGKVKLFRDVVSSKSFEYPITENQRVIEIIRDSVKQYKPFPVILEIWDEDNEQIRWSTSDWSVLPFA